MDINEYLEFAEKIDYIVTHLTDPSTSDSLRQALELTAQEMRCRADELDAYYESTRVGGTTL